MSIMGRKRQVSIKGHSIKSELASAQLLRAQLSVLSY
jgi:hypothetical protein